MVEDKLKAHKKIEDEEQIVEQVEKAGREIKEAMEGGEKEAIPEKEPVSRPTEKVTEVEPTREGEGELGKIAATAIPPTQQQRIKEIEHVLEERLSDMYINMLPEKQKVFKVVGEQTAKQINQLLNQTRVKVKKIIELIKRWLSLIPGVNKFFLEQEAKIKADKIMKMR